MLTAVQRLVSRAAGAVGRDSRIARALRPAYEGLLHRWAGDAGIEWEMNGAVYRIDPRVRSRLAHVYEAPVAEYLKQNVKPGDLCIDIGANVGAYAMQLARMVGSSGRVIAFEPNPSAREILQRHLSMNGISSIVTIEAAAVGARPGTDRLHMSGADGMARLAVVNPRLAARDTVVDVPVTTLDEYCEARGLRPDCILVDVEGFEGDVLEGAARTIASGRVRSLVVEFHPSAWSFGGGAPGRVRATVERFGLVPVPLTGQSDVYTQYGIVLLRGAAPPAAPAE